MSCATESTPTDRSSSSVYGTGAKIAAADSPGTAAEPLDRLPTRIERRLRLSIWMAGLNNAVLLAAIFLMLRH
jgi:hypothetical protein